MLTILRWVIAVVIWCLAWPVMPETLIFLGVPWLVGCVCKIEVRAAREDQGLQGKFNAALFQYHGVVRFLVCVKQALTRIPAVTGRTAGVVCDALGTLLHWLALLPPGWRLAQHVSLTNGWDMRWALAAVLAPLAGLSCLYIAKSFSRF
jgi:hypothetical protein